MQQWFKDSLWLVAVICGAVTFCYKTFPSYGYVNEKYDNHEHRFDRVSKFILDTQEANAHRLERMEDKLDRLLERRGK